MKAGQAGPAKRPIWLRVEGVRRCIPALLAAIAVAGAAAAHAQTHAPASAAAAGHKAGGLAQSGAAGQAANQNASGRLTETPRQQIDSECAALLNMAATLKAEVDKTTKDELSVAVVLQAGRIEKLARTVKDQMQPAVKKH
jgi:hypothetical protein